MTFAEPNALWALLGVGVLVVLNRRRREQAAIAFSSMAPLSGAARTWRQRLLRLPAWLGILASCAAILALARPQVRVGRVREEHEGIAIEMLVDVSSSMDMKSSYDGSRSSRLDIAKQVLLAFVLGDNEGLKGREHDLVGIITFARYADTVCPLTLGHDALAYLAREIEVNDRPNEDGTAYGDATVLAAARLKKLEEMSARSGRGDLDVASKIIVLLTDGENNCGRHLPMEAAALAREWGIRIYTISMGEKPRAQLAGTVAPSPLVSPEQDEAEDTLRLMAELTGGIHRTADDLDSLQAVYREIDRLETSRLRPVLFEERRELFWMFATASIALVVLDVAARNTLLRTVP
jgi:Ca-activated chloride channel homolog